MTVIKLITLYWQTDWKMRPQKVSPMVQRVAASVNSMIWTSVDVEAEVEIGFSLHFYFLENIIDKFTTSWYRYMEHIAFLWNIILIEHNFATKTTWFIHRPSILKIIMGALIFRQHQIQIPRDWVTVGLFVGWVSQQYNCITARNGFIQQFWPFRVNHQFAGLAATDQRTARGGEAI